jgi:hypothetical protein
VDKDGVEGPSYGSPTGLNPSGFLHYTQTGWMAVNMMSTTPGDRPYVAYPPKDTDTDKDWALNAQHTLSYAGPASVEPNSKTQGKVFHGPLAYAGVPGQLNTTQTRNYTIYENGNVLKISAFREDTGEVTNLFWRRAPDRLKKGKGH